MSRLRVDEPYCACGHMRDAHPGDGPCVESSGLIEHRRVCGCDGWEPAEDDEMASR